MKHLVLPAALYVYDRFVMFHVTIVGEFSCHMAALAALIRLHDPAFRRLGGADTLEDLEREPAFKKALIAIVGNEPELAVGHEELAFRASSAHAYELEIQAKATGSGA